MKMRAPLESRKIKRSLAIIISIIRQLTFRRNRVFEASPREKRSYPPKIARCAGIIKSKGSSQSSSTPLKKS